MTTAFFHGPLEETIDIRLPHEVKIGQGKIAKLKKGIYSLKQAGRCWNEKLDKWLISQEWTANEDDACANILKTSSGSISQMLYICVDD